MPGASMDAAEKWLKENDPEHTEPKKYSFYSEDELEDAIALDFNFANNTCPCEIEWGFNIHEQQRYPDTVDKMHGHRIPGCYRVKPSKTDG